MKKLLVLILTIILGLMSLTFIACDNSANNGNVSNDGVQNQIGAPVKGFSDGYATEFTVKEKIVLTDLIDNKGAKYNLKATKEGETDIVLTGEDFWAPEKIGKWSFVAEILDGENKGTYTLEINVNAPPITLEFSQNPVYLRAGEVQFSDLITKLKISSNFEEYGKVTKRIYSVKNLDDDSSIVEFTTETSYVFVKGTYNVIFGVEAEDGQVYKNIKKVSVQ